MSQTTIHLPARSKTYMTYAFWIFLILFGGRFLIKDAIPYFGFEEETFGRFWSFKWWLMGHVVGGFLALVIGPFQFSKTFRMKFTKAHRVMGRIYLLAILLAVISSTYLSWTTALKIHWTWSISLQFLAFAWFVTGGMALRFILLRRIQLHKEWMIRSYVVTFAFVLFRFLNEMPALKEMSNFIERGPTIGWVSWAVPLLIAEIILQWNKK